MKKYIVLCSLVISSISLNAQLKMNTSMATSALNSNVAKTIVVKSVNNTTPTYAAGMSGNLSATLNASPGVTSPGVSHMLSTVSSRFGYYSAYYAQLITVYYYSTAYQNVPFWKYLHPFGVHYLENPSYATRAYNQFMPSYTYFNDNKPGFLPYLYDRPASIFIDIGVTKPEPLAVDPASQSYPLLNTRFIKTVSLTY